jgi:hypothetical protein
MKNISLFILLVLAAATISCDTIDDPLRNTDPSGGNPGNDTTVVKQIILLEEFTGVKCNNCPAAAVEAKRLKELYGEQLLIIGVHAGNLAQTDPDHPRAFRTPEGTELFDIFSFPGVPLGLINRVDNETNQILKPSGDWRNVIPDLIDNTPVASMSLQERSFNANTRKLEVEGTVEIIGTLPTNNIYLSVYLIENDIISPQTMPDKSINADYEHDFVLRGSFNTTFGEQIDVSSNSIPFTKSITLDAEIVKENTAAIAFIYNRDTYEILQAVQVEL